MLKENGTVEEVTLCGKCEEQERLHYDYYCREHRNEYQKEWGKKNRDKTNKYTIKRLLPYTGKYVYIIDHKLTGEVVGVGRTTNIKRRAEQHFHSTWGTWFSNNVTKYDLDRQDFEMFVLDLSDYDIMVDDLLLLEKDMVINFENRQGKPLWNKDFRGHKLNSKEIERLEELHSFIDINDFEPLDVVLDRKKARHQGNDED